jgi:poly(3-hydroxybutyrate) depolymerase
MTELRAWWVGGLLAAALAAATGAATPPAPAGSGGRYVAVTYPPGSAPGELQLGVTFTLWVPDGVKRVRGVIVHQHGCGEGACKGGETAAYDLHWQALARKWDCALLGPSYQQSDQQNCRLWCDPRNGSDAAFRRALGELAAQAGRPEIATAPWCLWGHSGGGFWASLMQTLHPERIVAIWLRSGTAFESWESGQIPRPEIPPAAYGIPTMANPGAKEKGEARFDGAWTGALAMFRAYRAKGAPIGVAPDPRTGHECGDSRYLAIPFFDACLAQRLPGDGAGPLRRVDPRKGWLAPLLGHEARPAGEHQGDPNTAVWLPNRAVALAWSEYVRTGAVGDASPPSPPRNLRASRAQGGVDLTWEAAADLESGLTQFVILREGKEIGRVPQQPAGRFGRPLFQRMSYHDTPEKPLPELRYRDAEAGSDRPAYAVRAVNSVGLQSGASRSVRPD